MCAILDANVVGQVFGLDRPSAGQAFFDWLHSDRGRLVVGGQLRRELDRNTAFRHWRAQAVLAGRVTLLNDDATDSLAQQLENESSCHSDDEHIVAVAQLSGARLLYTNDRDLQRDFVESGSDAPTLAGGSSCCPDGFRGVPVPQSSA